MGRPKGGAVSAEDVGDLQRRTHGGQPQELAPELSLGATRAMILSSLAWPSRTWMTRMSTPSSSRCVAKLCRSVCGLTFLLSPAAIAAASTTRLGWRVVTGRAGSWPGNSHPPGRMTPWCRPSCHQARSRASRLGESRAWRPRPPLPRSTLTTRSSQGDQHALAVDVADLERRHFGDAQSGAIGDGEGGPVLEAGRCRDQARGLVGAEHDREFARIAQADQLAGEVRPVDGVVEEETQRGNGAVHGRSVHAALELLDLEPADVLCRRRAGRAGEEGGDGAEVVLAGFVGEPGHGRGSESALFGLHKARGNRRPVRAGSRLAMFRAGGGQLPPVKLGGAEAVLGPAG